MGCGRSLKEISDWSKMTYDERSKVMKRLGYGKRTSTKDKETRRNSR